jgi:hypothetical protein
MSRFLTVVEKILFFSTEKWSFIEVALTENKYLCSKKKRLLISIVIINFEKLFPSNICSGWNEHQWCK